MISERQFARGYPSFWRGLLPLSDYYVRRLNATKQSFALPAPVKNLRAWNAVVSEAAFFCFVHYLSSKVGRAEPAYDDSCVAEAWGRACAYVAQLGEDVPQKEPPDDQNQTAVVNLANALVHFFRRVEPGEKLFTQPQFGGCGLLDACEGDVIAGSVLYEIKNVDREFRAVDLRQVLIYAFLDHLAGARRVSSIGLVNARRGLYFRASLGTVCRGMAAVSPADLFREVELFLEVDAPVEN
jgi:hypothetical protein